MFKNYITEEAGASAAEYALILAIVGLGIVVAVSALSTQISSAIDETATTIENRGEAAPA